MTRIDQLLVRVVTNVSGLPPQGTEYTVDCSPWIRTLITQGHLEVVARRVPESTGRPKRRGARGD